MVFHAFPSSWLAIFFFSVAVGGVALFRLWDRFPRRITATSLVAWLALDAVALWGLLTAIDYNSPN